MNKYFACVSTEPENNTLFKALWSVTLYILYVSRRDTYRLFCKQHSDGWAINICSTSLNGRVVSE